MKKSLAILCGLSLMMSLLSGCGGETSVASEPADPSSIEETVQTTVPEDTPEPETEISSEEVEEIVEDVPQNVINYPLEEAVTISVFCPQDSMAFMLMDQMGLETEWSNVPTLKYVYEQVNFRFEFEAPSESGASEQFNLMIASGDWTDLFESKLYSGGVTQAYQDNVILELTELMPENMPDYWALLQAQDAMDRANIYNDAQQILSINDIYGSMTVNSGLLMRQDMLEAVGLDTPATIDDLTEALTLVHEKYSTEQTFYVGTDGIMSNVVGAFGTAGFDITGGSADLGFYVDQGAVQSALLSQNYYDYLQYFISLYQAGMIYSDFYSQVPSASMMNELSMGHAFIWSGDGGLIDSMTETGKAEVPEYQLCGIGAIVENPGDTYHFASASSAVETEGTCISATCKHVEEAMQALNWYFTEDGIEFCRWGVEGITYTIGDDGSEVFTDAVVDGIFPVNLMYGFYVWSPAAMYVDKDATLSEFSNSVLGAYDVWAKADCQNTLPASLSLTAEETDLCSHQIIDICTYAGEQVLKWILGNEVLTQESFADFGQTILGMGAQDCIDTYQNAYDRYASRISE